jgi:hypothetical protein
MINYQGQLSVNSTGEPFNGTATMVFEIWDDATSTESVHLLWSESRDVTVANGIYSLQLGEVMPLPTQAFANDDLWLAVTINDESFDRRRQLTSAPFALSADNALHAVDADSLEGKTSNQLDQSAHVTDTGNPHQVTPAQIGAATSTDLANHAADSSAHHVKTTSFSELTDVAADSQIPDTIARGSEIAWGNLADIPTGFADGIDNDSGGDITAVTAATGLVGGGDSGAVSLAIHLPLALTTATALGNQAVVAGSNTGNGYGLKGWAQGNYGVYGYSSAAAGVLGYSNDAAGMEGVNGTTGNEGRLGTTDYGVYGHAVAANALAGYFEGKVDITQNLGVSQDLTVMGDLGIGVDAATYKLFVRDDVEGLAYAFKLENHHAGDAPGESDVGILFATGGSGITERGKGALVYQTTTTWNRGSFHFLQDSGANSDNPDLDDSVMTITNSGRVGIGTTPETLFHVSADTSGDAVFLLEADTDNSNEDDQPNIEMRQDGGLVTAMVGFDNGENNFKIRSSQSIEFHTGEGESQVLAASLDTGANLHVMGNLQVDGDLVLTKTSYLAVPPTSFIPNRGTSHDGLWYSPSLVENDTTPFGGNAITLYASVNLPQGAEIVRVTCWWEDNTDDAQGFQPRLELTRYDHNTTHEDLVALLVSNWNDADRHLSYQTAIYNPVVNNYLYGYVAKVFLPEPEDADNYTGFGGMRIQYSYTP